MTYQVLIKRSAEKELAALPAKTKERIEQRLLKLESDPRPRGAKKLQGQESYRLRVGDYRVLYAVDDPARQVMVYAVGHRRDVYR
jgi:mRNA interferase RelE/StbE